MLEDAPKEIGMIYAIVAVLVLGYLFYKGKLNTRIGYLLIAVSATLGFLIFAPMLPNQMQVLLLGKTKQLAVPAGVAALILVVFVIITFILDNNFHLGKDFLWICVPHRGSAGTGLSHQDKEAEDTKQGCANRLPPAFPASIHYPCGGLFRRSFDSSGA